MDESKFLIVEEAPGYYRYHIALKCSFTKSLCKKDITMMQTSIPFSAWGYVGHLKEKYCNKCMEEMKKKKRWEETTWLMSCCG